MKSSVIDNDKDGKNEIAPVEPENKPANWFILGLVSLAMLLLIFIAVSYALFLKTQDRELAVKLNESVLFAFRYGFFAFLVLLSSNLGNVLKRILIRFSQGA